MSKTMNEEYDCDHDGTTAGTKCQRCGRLNMHPASLYARIVELEAQLAAANADPNDMDLVSPPPEKVETFKMVPVAEWERINTELVAAKSTMDLMETELRNNATDWADTDTGVRKCLAEFDNVGPYGYGMTPIEMLAERAAAALKQASADRDVLAAEVRASHKKIVSTEGGFIVMGSLEDSLNLHNARAATRASAALNRAGGGE